MNNRTTTIIVGVVLVLSIGFLVYTTKEPFVVSIENMPTATSTPEKTTKPTLVEKDESSKSSPSTVTKPVVTPPITKPEPKPTVPSGITLSQIAGHSSRTSCWSAINGDVYDLTSWIPNHPGGERTILITCGIDGSDQYNGQHGGKSKPARILMGFKIGTLAK